MQSREMALFIQDAVLLPNGRLEFRVALASELSLVASVLKGEYGLAMAALKSNSNLPCYRSVTECEIIDFHKLEDNSLYEDIYEYSELYKRLGSKFKVNNRYKTKSGREFFYKGINPENNRIVVQVFKKDTLEEKLFN